MTTPKPMDRRLARHLAVLGLFLAATLATGTAGAVDPDEMGPGLVDPEKRRPMPGPMPIDDDPIVPPALLHMLVYCIVTDSCN